MIERIAYYVTAHGYGHGVRSTDILNALFETSPSVEITVVSELPVWFLESRLKFSPRSIRAKSFDVGMVQLDSVKVDLKATAKHGLTLRRAKSIDVNDSEQLISLFECYSDADFAGEDDTRKSTSGMVIMFSQTPLLWRSSTQRLRPRVLSF